MVDIKDSKILLVLEAISERLSTLCRDLVVIKEKHVKADMISEGISKASRTSIIDFIFTQVDSLHREI